MHSFDLKGDPEGQQYASLIDFVGMRTSLFGLIRRSDRIRADDSLLQRARPFLLSEQVTSTWPGTWSQGTVTLYQFTVNAESLSFLSNEVTSLYSWGSYDEEIDKEIWLEDLHFLRSDGRPMLISVTHERWCRLQLEVEEVAEFETLSQRVGLAYSIIST